MKKYSLLIFSLLFLFHFVIAQNTIPKKEYHPGTDKLLHKFEVLKSEPTLKHGLYQQYSQDGKEIVSGNYQSGVKTGSWTYNLITDYGTSELRIDYEVGNNSTSSQLFHLDMRKLKPEDWDRKNSGKVVLQLNLNDSCNLDSISIKQGFTPKTDQFCIDFAHDYYKKLEEMDWKDLFLGCIFKVQFLPIDFKVYEGYKAY